MLNQIQNNFHIRISGVVSIFCLKPYLSSRWAVIENDVDYPINLITFVLIWPCVCWIHWSLLSYCANHPYYWCILQINGLCAENMICDVDEMEATCEEEVEGQGCFGFYFRYNFVFYFVQCELSHA